MVAQVNEPQTSKYVSHIGKWFRQEGMILLRNKPEEWYMSPFLHALQQKWISVFIFEVIIIMVAREIPSFRFICWSSVKITHYTIMFYERIRTSKYLYNFELYRYFAASSVNTWSRFIPRTCIYLQHIFYI